MNNIIHNGYVQSNSKTGQTEPDFAKNHNFPEIDNTSEFIVFDRLEQKLNTKPVKPISLILY